MVLSSTKWATRSGWATANATASARRVVTDKYRSGYVEVVEHGHQFGPVVLKGVPGGTRAIGPTVPEPVEGNSAPWGQPRQKLVVDPVIVGKTVHQDDRGILTRYFAHEDVAVGRTGSSLAGEHSRFCHNSLPFISNVLQLKGFVGVSGRAELVIW